MWKIALAVVLFIVLVFTTIQVYSFFVQERQLSADLQDVQSRLTTAQTNETDLQNEVQYLANPLNLEKELRARFNYKNPGETMIIIVPAQSSTASSTLPE
jgi:cell division protein FtsL